MSGLSAGDLLRLPVRLNGREIGRAVDVIVDLPERRVLGFDVLCRDEPHRFLPFTAASIDEGGIAVESSLALLAGDELDFYRTRAGWLRELVPDLQEARVNADGTLELVISDDAA
jgi:hypothetical protein